MKKWNFFKTSQWTSTKDGSTLRPEAATRSDILYLFGQQILILSGESRRILKTDACGNHAIAIFGNLRTRL